METETYIGSRLIILFIGVILSWYGAYYILPNYIREDGFGFVEQVDVFFSLSFFFSMLFLIYTLCEIQKFKKTRNIKLKNVAIYLSIFFFIITAIFFVFDRIYS